MGVDLGKDVFGKITAASFALGNLLEGRARVEKKGPGFRTVTTSPEIPAVFVLQATDEEAAGKLLELVPKAVSQFTGKEVKPVGKDVAGQKVYLSRRRGRAVLRPPGQHSRVRSRCEVSRAGPRQWSQEQRLAVERQVGRPAGEGEVPIMLAVARPFTLLAGLSVTGWSQSRTVDRVGPAVKSSCRRPRGSGDRPPRSSKRIPSRRN